MGVVFCTVVVHARASENLRLLAPIREAPKSL
jgi:hypothetical protein